MPKDPTPFHDFDQYEDDEPWDHNDDFQRIDINLELRLPLENRPSAAPDGAKFIVDDPGTDSHGEVYRYDTDVDDWVLESRQFDDVQMETGSIAEDPEDPRDLTPKEWVEGIIDSGSGGDITADTLSISNRDVVDANQEGYPGDQSGGDIVDLFRDHPESTIILPEGDYSVQSGLDWTSTSDPERLCIIGEPHARLHVDAEGGLELFKLGHGTGDREFKELILQNLTLVVNNSGDGEDLYDAGWGTWWVDDLIYNKNLEIEGRRDHAGVEHYHDKGDNTCKYGYHANIVTETGIGVHQNIRLPDGDHFYEGQGSFEGAIGFSSEPGHIGTNYWLGCHVEEFWDNGFYLKTSDTGRNIMIGCTAVNCGAGLIRLGRNDSAINCATWWDLDVDALEYEVPNYGAHLDMNQGEGSFITGHRAINETSENAVVRVRGPTRNATLRDLYVENETSYHSLRVTYSGNATEDDLEGTVKFENCFVRDRGDGSTRGEAVLFDRPNCILKDSTIKLETDAWRSPIKVEGESATIKDCNLENTGGNPYDIQLGRANTSSSNEGKHVDRVEIVGNAMTGGLFLRDPDTAYPNTFGSILWYGNDLRGVVESDLFYEEDPYDWLEDELVFHSNLGHLTNTTYGDFGARELYGAEVYDAGNRVASREYADNAYTDSDAVSAIESETDPLDIDISGNAATADQANQADQATDTTLWDGYEIYVQNSEPSTSEPYIRFEDE